MRTKTIQLFQFDELSDEAKETARAWFREGAFDYDWYSSVYDMVATDLHGGVPNRFAAYPYASSVAVNSFDLDRRSIDITATIDHRALLEACAKDFAGGKYTNGILKLYDMDYIQYTNGQWHWYGSRHCSLFAGFVDTLPETKDIEQEIGETVLSMLQAEADYLESDETVDENIRCNEYEFTETGKRA